MAKINDFYRAQKPFMNLEADGLKRRPPKSTDLRVQVLAQEATKRQCQGRPDQAMADVETPTDVQQTSEAQPDTDFTNFNRQIRDEQQGKQRVDPPLHLEQQQQQPRYDRLQSQLQQHFDAIRPLQEQHQLLQQPGRSGLLDSLLSQHSLSALNSKQQDLQMNGAYTFLADQSREGFPKSTESSNLQQPPSNLPSAATAAINSSKTAGTAAVERWHLQHLEQLPWDWSLKQRVRLASAEPFALLEEQWAAGLGTECEVLSAGGQCRRATADLQYLQARLCAALTQFQFPLQPLGTTLLASMMDQASKDSSSASLTWISDRVNSWRDALRSAFLQLRHGSCPVLYVIGQAFQQQFAAMFCCGCVLNNSSSSSGGGGGGLVAVVSRTNRAMRQHFADHGAEGGLAGLLEQQQQQQQQQAGDSHAQLGAAAFDGQPGSQLLLCGALQVHGLCAALLALPWCEQDQPDVPLLLAPVQFENAALVKLRLEVLPDAVVEQQQQQQLHASMAAANATPHLRYAELTAPGGSVISPWAVYRLGQLLLQTQAAAGFDVFLQGDAFSSSLNIPSNAWPQAHAAAVLAAAPGLPEDMVTAALQDAAATAQQQQQQPAWQQQELGFASAEQHSWQYSLSVLQGRMLKQLRVQGGASSLSARLA